MQDDSSIEVAIMPDSNFQLFIHEIEQHKDPEVKLRIAFDFMEKAISSEKMPDFKSFWEIRKKCLELFKENLTPVHRAQFWSQFSNLSKEARRLKDQFDEQSDFTAEQIDIAIQAVESDIQNSSDLIAKTPDIQLFENIPTFTSRYEFYNSLQKELNFLNLLAIRINALRKELIKTEMRIRIKNQFFDRLSKMGNVVFPRRKELVNQISLAFQEDVEQFVNGYFSQKVHKEPLFSLRQKIQTLQSTAKILTLNSQVFSSTRLSLSACWDQTKELDKERKQEFEKKKEIFKKNSQDLLDQISQVSKQFESKELSSSDTFEKMNQISTSARSIDLGRIEVVEVRKALGELREKIKLEQDAQEKERLKQEEVRNKVKKDLISNIENKLRSFVTQSEQLDLDSIQKQKDEFVTEIQQATLNKIEKNELEKLLNPLKEVMRRKKEEILMALPADERQALDQLREMLRDKKKQRDEIKTQIEQLRRVAGSSGFDIQQAMNNDQRLKEEKRNLELVLQAIKEIENKIDELELVQ